MNPTDPKVPEHYKTDGELHWDRMWRLYGRGYFVGCATKYIERYHRKDGEKDLKKAIHFLEKLISLEYSGGEDKSFNPEHAPLASFPQVAPSGWIGYVFEGVTANRNIFKCKACRAEFGCPVDMDPGIYHKCITARPPDPLSAPTPADPKQANQPSAQ
jgi:hypothetical protein